MKWTGRGRNLIVVGSDPEPRAGCRGKIDADLDAVMEGGIVVRGERSRNPAFTEGDVADLCVVAG